MGTSPVPDVAGIYGVTEPPERRQSQINPATFGFAGGGGRALMGVNDLFSGIQAAHAWRETQKIKGIQTQWELADRAYRQVQEELARPGITDQERLGLESQLRQAYEQRKRAYDLLSEYFTAEGRKGGGKRGQGGDQRPTRMDHLKQFFHNFLVGPEPTLPERPGYPPVPSLAEPPGAPTGMVPGPMPSTAAQ